MFGPSADVFENIPSEAQPAPRPVEATGGGTLGASPDGLGHEGMGAYANAIGGKVDFLEPVDASPQAALRTAGIVSLSAAVCFGTGLALGGAWGAMSGIVLSGAGFNVYRAQKWWGSPDPSEKHEAVVSALFGALGLAAGGYAAYKAYQAKG